MRHWSAGPEHPGGGAVWLLAAGLAVLVLLALVLLVGSVVTDARPALDPGRLLESWAGR
jgi:hypothetical protein